MDEVVRGRVVMPDGVIDDGWVAITGGKVAAVGTGEAPVARRLFDAGGSFVLPGMVDGQTHAGSYRGLPESSPRHVRPSPAA